MTQETVLIGPTQMRSVIVFFVFFISDITVVSSTPRAVIEPGALDPSLAHAGA
jgi:hypothetical protein